MCISYKPVQVDMKKEHTLFTLRKLRLNRKLNMRIAERRKDATAITVTLNNHLT